MRLFVASLNRALTPQRLRQIWYIPSLAIAMVLMMVRLMIVARLLPVEEFATLSSGILVSGAFGMLGCLGLQSVLQRDWPMLLIRGQEYRGLVLAAQSNLVAVGCALVGLCVAASGVSIAGVKPIVFCIGVLHGLSQQFFSIATIESRSRGRMFDYARHYADSFSWVFLEINQASCAGTNGDLSFGVQPVSSSQMAFGGHVDRGLGRRFFANEP